MGKPFVYEVACRQCGSPNIAHENMNQRFVYMGSDGHPMKVLALTSTRYTCPNGHEYFGTDPEETKQKVIADYLQHPRRKTWERQKDQVRAIYRRAFTAFFLVVGVPLHPMKNDLAEPDLTGATKLQLKAIVHAATRIQKIGERAQEILDEMAQRERQGDAA